MNNRPNVNVKQKPPCVQWVFFVCIKCISHRSSLYDLQFCHSVAAILDPMCTDSIHLQYEHGSSNQTMVEKMQFIIIIFFIRCYSPYIHCNAIPFDPMWCDVMWCGAMQKNHCYLFIVIISRQFYSFFVLKNLVVVCLPSIRGWFLWWNFFCHYRASCSMLRLSGALQYNHFTFHFVIVCIYLFCCNKNTIFIYLSKRSC